MNLYKVILKFFVLSAITVTPIFILILKLSGRWWKKPSEDEGGEK